MTPDSSFEWEEIEFEKELKKLGKKEFLEFRRKFREFSSEINNQIGLQIQGNINEKLKIISRKLHLIKREFEKRETIEQTQEKIQEIINSPEDSLQLDPTDYKAIIHQMGGKDFTQYMTYFKELYQNILNNRKEVIQQNSSHSPFDKKHREHFKIIKRWDLLEEELGDREKRMAMD